MTIDDLVLAPIPLEWSSLQMESKVLCIHRETLEDKDYHSSDAFLRQQHSNLFKMAGSWQLRMSSGTSFGTCLFLFSIHNEKLQSAQLFLRFVLSGTKPLEASITCSSSTGAANLLFYHLLNDREMRLCFLGGSDSSVSAELPEQWPFFSIIRQTHAFFACSDFDLKL